jgi:uncharacterized protein YuzE
MCQTIAIVRADEKQKVIGSAVWKIEFDEETKSVYLHTIPADTETRTSGLITHRDAYLDIDDLGRVTGVEIFDWPLE